MGYSRFKGGEGTVSSGSVKQGAEPFWWHPGDGTAAESWILFHALSKKTKSNIRVTIFSDSVEKVSFKHKTAPLGSYFWGLFKLRIKTLTSAFRICT